MSREVRKVHKDWIHPKYNSGRYIPLMDNFNSDKRYYEEHPEEDYKPQSKYYMPEWKEEEKTHFMMYETTSEGTPISPAFTNIEALAHWLADNRASSFANETATYEQWLATCRQGWAISAVSTGGKLTSGVEDTIIDEE